MSYKENDIAGARKDDQGKSPVLKGAIAYFPRAIESVASVSAFGATKYAWGGWRYVDNGLDRYSDAMVRHLTAEGKGEMVDPESGLLHAAHTAWNALARLELMIQDRDSEKEFKSKREYLTLPSKPEVEYFTNPNRLNPLDF